MYISALEHESGLVVLAWLTTLNKSNALLLIKRKCVSSRTLKTPTGLNKTDKNKGVADILKLVHKFLDPLTLYLKLEKNVCH